MNYINSKFTLLILFFSLLLPFTVSQAKDKAIIVFDASGSMLGQFEGKSKIDIARAVLGTLVKDWNEDIELGLIAYGHREKDNCNDIEILQPVTKPDSKSIQNIVINISPFGKSPISQSLRKAADTLRFTEEAATVILISDGDETCDLDPCAVAQDLEAKGIDFTAHVIGIDIKENNKAQEQLKCVAKNTGGLFFETEDVDNLKQAIDKVEEPTELIKITLIAVNSNTNKTVKATTEWSIINLSTEAIQTYNTEEASFKAKLVAGDYEIFVTVGGMTGNGKIMVSNKPNQELRIQVSNAEAIQPFDAPSSISAGEVMKFNWNGPNITGDMIFITKPDEPHNRYYSTNRHKVEKGMPAILTAPAKAGDYEIRYFSYGNGTVLNRAPLKVSQADVNIERPKEIPAGKRFAISWSGPDSQGDLIFVTEKDLDDNKYYTSESKYIRTQDGASGQLIAPAKPGDYEIRYYSKSNGDILARFPLKVGESGVTFKAPRIASVGTKINVEWTGPNEEGDLIFICEPDVDENRYYYGSERSFNTSDKSPAILTVPAKPGAYEIRYYSKDNGDVLARRALIVR